GPPGPSRLSCERPESAQPRRSRVFRRRTAVHPFRPFATVVVKDASGHQQRSDNVPAWSGQPHKADLSKNSPSMLLSATSEALARLRVSDLTAAAPCGPSLFERYESGATGIGKLENDGSRPEAISEIARLRRSLPEPGPENRAAINIRSARPPIITVTGGWGAPTPTLKIVVGPALARGHLTRKYPIDAVDAAAFPLSARKPAVPRSIEEARSKRSDYTPLTRNW